MKSNRRRGLSGTHARVTMEVVVAAQSGTLVHASRILQRRAVPIHRGGVNGPYASAPHSAWCAWLAKEMDHPPHHACEFSARLKGGRMLEIQSFF